MFEEVDTDDDEGDDEDGGGTLPGGGPLTPVDKDPVVGNDPAGGVLRGGGGSAPTDEGGGRITAAGALGAVKLLSGISGA